jgi:hypothetical protein
MIAREFLAELNRLHLETDDAQAVRDTLMDDANAAQAILSSMIATARKAPGSTYGEIARREDAVRDLQCALDDVQRALPALLRLFGGAA